MRPPLLAAAIMVGFFAIFHGHAHGTELPAGANGLLSASASSWRRAPCTRMGIGIGAIHRWGWGRMALRVTGAVVASAGGYFLWRALA